MNMSKMKLMGAVALARAPEAVTDVFYAGRRKTVDGRRIDSKAQALGDLLNLARDLAGEPTIEQSRKGLRGLAAKFDEPCPSNVRKRDLMLPGADGDRPARLYDAVTGKDDVARPTLLFLHGGGWVQGDLDTHDGLCGKLADWAGIRVIAYDYRLAPEHKFPAGPDDVLACYRALRETPEAWGVDPARMAVGGDSAGGNLTAVLMHDLQVAGLPLPVAQLLIYPAVDMQMTSPSMRALPEAYVLPVDRISWFLDLYLPDGQDRSDPRIAPLNSAHLEGQPDALIVVGGHDPLWDDGWAYAKALRQAGVDTILAEFPGQIHVFVSATRAIPQGNVALRGAAEWLARRIG